MTAKLIGMFRGLSISPKRNIRRCGRHQTTSREQNNFRNMPLLTFGESANLQGPNVNKCQQANGPVVKELLLRPRD
jgi:hypothetical protein